MLNLLSDVSGDGPLLCVVDGARWLDRESLQALTFMASRLLADRVGLEFTTRFALPDLAAFPELPVEALHHAEAQTLLSEVLRVPLDERVRDRIVAETHGNPLALVEWPRGLTSTELAGGFGLPATMPMSGQIEGSFRRRLAGCRRRRSTSSRSRRPGRSAMRRSCGEAARLVGIDDDAAFPAVDAGLLEIGPRVVFRHPLVRSAAYGSASLDDRRAAHRALAEVSDSGADPDRRAWHRAQAAAGPDEVVALELEQSAARAQSRGGLAAAAAFLDRSVALTADPASIRADSRPPMPSSTPVRSRTPCGCGVGRGGAPDVGEACDPVAGQHGVPSGRSGVAIAAQAATS